MEKKRGQRDKETASAEMLNPNLYPGGLRCKEKPKTQVSLGSEKKSILKKDKKIQGPELLLLIFLCGQCVCVW